MPTPSLQLAVRQLRRIAVKSAATGFTDRQLLEQFITHFDQDAFAALVHRHGPLVMGVCRRILGDRQEAEDSFQATFLVLVRKAHSLREPERLGNWLYGVAHRTASKARTRLARHRACETLVGDVPDRRSHDDVDRREVWKILDEEIARLPDKYRTPLVICYLQGHTNEQAARLLECPKGTIAIRLARARERLRKRLLQRGLGISAGMLGTLLAEGASAAVSLHVVNVTVGTALTVVADSTALAAKAGPVAALAQEVLKSMVVAKVKTTLMAGLLLGALGTGVGLGVYTCAGSAASGEAAPTVQTAALDMPPNTRNLEEEIYAALRATHCWHSEAIGGAIRIREIKGRQLFGLAIDCAGGVVALEKEQAEIRVVKPAKNVVLDLRRDGKAWENLRLSFGTDVKGTVVRGAASAEGASTSGFRLEVGTFCLDGLPDRLKVRAEGDWQVPSTGSLLAHLQRAPAALKIQWKRSMFFDGKLARFHGGVQAEQGSSVLHCQDLRARFDRAATSQEDPALRVLAVVCDKNVCIDDGQSEDKQLLRRTRLQAPEVHVDKEESIVTASGPGQVDILQSSNAAKPISNRALCQPTARPDGKSDPSAPKENVTTLTRIHFHEKLWSDNKQETSIFYGAVELIQLPSDNLDMKIEENRPPPGCMHLRCQQLKVFNQTPRDRKSTQEMEARKNVLIEAQEFWGQADLVKYDPSKELVTLEGGANGLAMLIRVKTAAGEPHKITAKKIWYYRKTNECHIENGRRWDLQ